MTLALPETFYGGIDCGLSGAVVGLTGSTDQPKVVFRQKTPTFKHKVHNTRYDVRGMYELLEGVKKSYVNLFFCIEKSHSRRTDSRPAAWTTGCGYGFWLMALTALNIPFEVVGPKEWQNTFFPPRIERVGGPKDLSIKTAQEILPGLDLLPTSRCRKLDHNISDAGLLALFGMKKRASAGG